MQSFQDTMTSYLHSAVTDLDWLHENHGLKERHKERHQPIKRLFVTPLHTVQDGEEARRRYAEETDYKRDRGEIK